MKKDSILIIINFIVLAIIISLFCFDRCSGDDSEPVVIDTLYFSDTSIVLDTIPFYDTIPVSIAIEIPDPEIIDTVNNIRVYKDSTSNEDISIFWIDTVQGNLIGKSLSYKLFVPKEIVKTVTIDNTQTITKTVEKSYNKLYLDVILGTSDKNIGLTFIPKKDRFKFGYNYNISSNSHNVQLGVKLWQSKK